ncbi:MAG: hypothetical protein KA419_01355 [Acidobacteria bacterium]|nr:hypothetical protein [Acidobacteriota bacterium]
MTREDPAPVPRHEPRWPAAAAILFVLALLVMMPARIRILPGWYVCTVTLTFVLPMLLSDLPATRRWFEPVERVTTVLCAGVVMLATLMSLRHVVIAILNHSSGMTGLQLLSSSVGAWATNVIAFSLVYWQTDRGGPALRAKEAGARPDWVFPAESAPPALVKPFWRPVFIDYLFLGFSTATAFSSTDALPLTTRAKLLMMLESAVSLTTILVVASRAINILG